MPIFSDTFTVYERLASAKMRSLVDQINAHTHGGVYGAPVNLDYATGQISGTTNIIDNSITWNKLVTTGTGAIHLSSDGYAVYAP